MNESLDYWDELPKEQRKYYANNGRHFNKRAYEFACSKMYKKEDGKKAKMKPIDKTTLNEFLDKHGVKLENDELYDACYVYTMIESDFIGKSIHTDKDKAMHIKAMIDDADKKKGYLFNRFYADMTFEGVPIPWSDLL